MTHTSDVYELTWKIRCAWSISWRSFGVQSIYGCSSSFDGASSAQPNLQSSKESSKKCSSVPETVLDTTGHVEFFVSTICNIVSTMYGRLRIKRLTSPNGRFFVMIFSTTMEQAKSLPRYPERTSPTRTRRIRGAIAPSSFRTTDTAISHSNASGSGLQCPSQIMGCERKSKLKP